MLIQQYPSMVWKMQESMDKYEGLEYVKTDLVKSKGIIYVKFRLASSALKAKEDIEKNNYMVRDAFLTVASFGRRMYGADCLTL